MLLVVYINLANDTLFDFGGNSSHGFRVTGGLSVFGTVFGRLSVFCISAVSPRGIVGCNVSTVLTRASPCARCCPRRSGALGRVADKGFNNVKSMVHCCAPQGHITVVRPSRKDPTTRVKLGTNSVVVRVGKGSVTRKSEVPGSLASCIDSGLHNRPKAAYILGIREPASSDACIPVRFGVAHSAVHAGPMPCCKVMNGGIKCVIVDAFTVRGYSGSVGGTLVRLGRRNTGSVILSLHNGNNNLLKRTIGMIGFFIPGKGRVIMAGNGVGRTNAACGAVGRPMSARVPLTILISNSATSTSRVISNSLRSLSQTVIMKDHACNGKLMRMPHRLPCGDDVGIAATGCCVPDKQYVRTVSCTGHGTSKSITHAPSDLAGMFRATTKHRIHSNNNVHPSIRIGIRGFPGVVFCLLGSSVVFSCTARCYVGRSRMKRIGSFAVASTSCISFGGVLRGHGFACSHRDRGVLGGLGRVTRFRKCVSKTGRRFTTLRAGLARGLSRRLSEFSGRVGSTVTRRVLGHCCFRHNTVLRHLGSSPSLGGTVRALGGRSRCDGVLSIVGWSGRKQVCRSTPRCYVVVPLVVLCLGQRMSVNLYYFSLCPPGL